MSFVPKLASALYAAVLSCSGFQTTLAAGTAAGFAQSYTADQAGRGERVVRQSCLLCHSRNEWAQPQFLEKWSRQPLSALYDFIRVRMPLDAPGKLSAQQYLDVVAYILELNHVEPGSIPLAMHAGDVHAPAARSTYVFRSEPLGAGPWEFDTASYTIRVSVLARGLANPWSMAFLPNGDALLTERVGRLRRLRQGVLDPMPIEGLPDIYVNSVGGLLDVVLHPQFERNRLIYLSYVKPGTRGCTTAVARARLDGSRLTQLRDVLVSDAWYTGPNISDDTAFGGRLAFDHEGLLYVTVGDRNLAAPAQDPGNHFGKILRIRADGSVPPDNPFLDRPQFKPEIYTLGQRNPQGLAFHPITGELWSTEHGPQGGDELNVIRRGLNYGWPRVSMGRNYDGTVVGEGFSLPGLEPPLVFWVPSIAPSGLAIYHGNRFPDWKGNAFVGAMRVSFQQNTGHMQRLVFSERGLPVAREPLLTQLKQRIRDIREGPDGLLYVLTDEPDGALLRIEPAQ